MGLKQKSLVRVYFNFDVTGVHKETATKSKKQPDWRLDNHHFWNGAHRKNSRSFEEEKKQRLSQMFMVTIDLCLYLSSSIWQKLSWVPQQITSLSTTNTIAFQNFTLDESGPESLHCLCYFVGQVTVFWSIFGEVTSLCGNSRLYLTNSSKVKNTFLHVTQIMCCTALPFKN